MEEYRLMNAATANVRARSLQNEKNKKILDHIRTEIESSVESGCFSVTVETQCNTQIIEILEKLGYQIEKIGSHRNEGPFLKISW